MNIDIEEFPSAIQRVSDWQSTINSISKVKEALRAYSRAE